MLMNERWLVKGESMLYWSWCYIGCEALVTLSSPSEAPLWGRSNSRSPPTFWAPGDPRGPPCLCKLLFPLHAQNPSPPRCARRGLGRLQASQAVPGSRRPSHSAGGTMNPTESGLDLQKQEKRNPDFAQTNKGQCNTKGTLSLPLRGDNHPPKFWTIVPIIFTTYNSLVAICNHTTRCY